METVGTYAIIYTYDYDGKLISFNYDSNKNDTTKGIEYYYIRNQQGDITKIVDKDGTIVVEYTYDAWGKLLKTEGSLASTIGQHNPYRYRGYRYDDEISMYYLNSRFYDANIGRFINADGLFGPLGMLNSTNVYTYVLNNPIMYFDPSGKMAWALPLAAPWLSSVAAVLVPLAPYIIAAAIIIIVVVVVYYAVSNTHTHTNSLDSSYNLAKDTKKARATDKPSWVDRGMVNSSLKANQNAENLLNNKYGNGNWPKGPRSEFSKIVKWLIRSKIISQVITSIEDEKDSMEAIIEFDQCWRIEYGNY